MSALNILNKMHIAFLKYAIRFNRRGGGGVVDVLKEHLCYSMYIELCYYTFTNISTRTKKSYYTKRLKLIDSKDIVFTLLLDLVQKLMRNYDTAF